MNLVLYKLIILYMLDRVDEYTLTNEQLTSFIQDRGYTSLFNVHESISELIADGFISVNTIRDVQHYQITDDGEKALLYYENRISNIIKQEILEFFKQEKIKIREQSELTADVDSNESQEYVADLKIKERAETILEIKLAVPTRALADHICDNWRSNSAEVYQKVNALLLQDNSSQ